MGRRWGDLSTGERLALPCGARVLAFDLTPELTLNEHREWVDSAGVRYYFPSPHQRLAEACATSERDSAGAIADWGGGEMRTGDNDHDGDVPEVAREVARLVLDYGGYAYTHAEETQTDRGISTRYSGLVRIYWPPTCQGAEDAPRDCLP